MAIRTANPGVAVKSRRLTDDERADLLVEYYLFRDQGYTALEAARMINTSYLTVWKWEHRLGTCLRFLYDGEAWICEKTTRKALHPLSEVA